MTNEIRVATAINCFPFSQEKRVDDELPLLFIYNSIDAKDNKRNKPHRDDDDSMTEQMSFKLHTYNR
jgi:hypothetical protein